MDKVAGLRVILLYIFSPHLLEPITNQLHLTSSVVAKFRGGGGTPAPLQKQAAMV